MDKTEKLIDWEEDERKDSNRNGLRDDIEPPPVDITAGAAKLANRLRNDSLADPTITAGDLDAQWESAQFSGVLASLDRIPAKQFAKIDRVGIYLPRWNR